MYKNGKPNYNEITFTDEELEDIKRMYNNNISSVKIGKKYNVSHKAILKALRRMNVEIVQAKSRRVYQLDESYFDIIDTEHKAYVLGFLYSDGSLNSDKQTVSLSLQEGDMWILEQIRKELKSTKPLEFLDYSNKHTFGYSYKNQYRLLLFSKHICNELIKKGVVQNKSLKISFPTFLPDNLVSHFIRGVYDGDGSIYRQIKSPKNHAVTVTITATESFCISLQQICKEKLNINAGIYDASCHNGITKVFMLSGRNVCKTFLDWIYQDSTMHLPRKYQRYIEYYTENNSLLA